MQRVKFKRKVPYPGKSLSEKSDSIVIFEDIRGIVYIQPHNDRKGADNRLYVALPKEDIDDIIEVLKDLKND